MMPPLRPRTLRALVMAATSSAVVLTLWACRLAGEACSGVGYKPLTVTIVDRAGRGQALGATVTLIDGSYQGKNTTSFDTLSIDGADTRGGRTYDVRVSKPFTTMSS